MRHESKLKYSHLRMTRYRAVTVGRPGRARRSALAKAGIKESPMRST
jgi:hypothetical protein